MPSGMSEEVAMPQIEACEDKIEKKKDSIDENPIDDNNKKSNGDGDGDDDGDGDAPNQDSSSYVSA
jgi:hypothetical protein